ncbi:p-hydroxybenzoic acid efflux pump subunit AaeB [Pantoea sp. PA1]|jgi:p-hydroxybenzoic acid efflux pump subunit AaeB|uniref:p-hydroxybenzoic acid efflux pump subunit AaeB n=2 Tax=Pantoea ananas TaxID=553 RepID=AAEB_PANAM|nr:MULTISPECIES: p-hydroxybenzoic acid efflux pump subunit AaeB [Pantoea]D4GCB2.1 RecName: Full=p-hydroxybenzoic acid efflux pump subunit AaeB; Short=pHBA efflux pump protein B [Pantoea ananatis LMG 20103]ADD78723.1 AaeB [Pantoea ananatis LMG 20103]ASN17551.1 p-hydroxybenzoic acid efflux pump subunit AaeB [Pantoea ananatis]ERM14809.1 hydroxybenzoic acid transporter [Pantoea ananatis BRT175]MCH9272168.1 p-hydroxybenzoic acid efflux pump subunit AaeB [Pantoea ananatis]MCS4495532.1 p-hydroxybenz
MTEFLRFPIKLTFALVAALMIGFHLNLETPRWAVMTAGIVAGGTAFAAGGDPYSGALRYRGILRIIGTFIGCVAALVIMIATVRAPVVMLLLCCIWAGFCVWLSSLIKVENSYALGLAGYTALIIVVTANASGGLTLVPQYAVERCSEIILGILCAILADMIFSPRSIKKVIDAEVDSLLVAHYRLLQLCVAHEDKEEVDKAWGALVRRTTALSSMRSQLMMESSRWQNTSRRLQMLNTLSLTMITQAAETFLIQNSRPDYIATQYRVLMEKEAATAEDVHKRMKALRRLIAVSSKTVPETLESWVEAATEYQLLTHGIKSNGRITALEEGILQREVVIQARSAENHHAMINGVRTFVATALGSLFWLYTGWTSGSGCMVMLGVITALAMRMPNPLMMAKDFVYGMTVAVPLGALYFMYILPNTQQSAVLLCIAIGLLGFISGILIQRRQIGTLGAMVGTINVLVLDNPMQFNFTQFIDNALGQWIGSFVALMVILLIRDKSKARTGRKLLNRFMYAAVSAMTTNQARRRENHLPALYQQLFLLLNLFPGDIDKYRIALTLIIGHQRLRAADVPVNADLSAYHRQLRHTADRIISVRSDEKRRYYFERLLKELDVYQHKLAHYDAPTSVTEPVTRLAEMLKKYQNTLVQI